MDLGNPLVLVALFALGVVVMKFATGRLGIGVGGARITGPVARQKVAAGAVLVDVRSKSEYDGGALPGAIHIPVDQVAQRVHELPTDKDVIVYCASGARSARAQALLEKAGLIQVFDLGPMSAW